MSRAQAFDALVTMMSRLRGPGGCPWDQEQSLQTLKPYLIEEAYEVLEAMDGPKDHLREELGDLLFQIVFQSRLAEEAGEFDLYDVAEGILNKMTRRHPHVFKETQEIDTQLDSAAAVAGSWEARKRDERRKKRTTASVLDGIPTALPALLQGWRMTEKASRVGFDWPDVSGVKDKLNEELQELDQALASGNAAEIEHELGDVLFTLVNLSRFVQVNPEEAMRKANLRFQARFQHLERALEAEGLRPETQGIDALERRWQDAKQALASKPASE